jgi:hypothetical protein
MSIGSDAHLGTWLVVGVLIGLALALLLGVLALGVRRARRSAGRRAGRQPDAPARTGAFPDDDLPGFAERPPGWTPEEAPPDEVDQPRDDRGPTGSGRGETTAVAGAVVLLTAAVLLAWAGGGDPVAAAQFPTSTATPAPVVVPTPAPATPTGAAALAFESVPLGEDGVAASVTFQGVVLEQRAVGLTVTYPSVSVSTDGRRSLAHVRLPTFNCLTAEPPADPVAAGCARSLTEYADLASPQLQVSRDGDRVDLVGLFPTYTRPNGSAPGLTGRAYQLSATIAADGPADDGAAPATGVVRIGLDSAPTTTDRGVNLLQRP